MLNLNDREWKAFFIKDLFPMIQRGRRLVREHQKNGDIPYVSSTAANNGVDAYISTERQTRVFSNCLTLANSGSVGSSFYQPFAFIASDHVTHLKNESYSQYVYLFIATLTKRLSEKYNFNREINDMRISKEKILLPIDADGKPDYAFMEQYIKEREEKMLEKYRAYAADGVNVEESSTFEEVEWKEFKVLSLFEYQRGNQNNMNALADGEDMLISAKNVNNGLKGFYCSANKNKGLFPGNCITLNNDGDGGVGLAYYQPHPFLLDTHVYALYPKAKISSYAMIYIAQALSKQRVCFSHGYSINQERLKSMQIMLPVDAGGNPHYAFMERDIREREKRKLTKYIAYIDSSRRA